MRVLLQRQPFRHDDEPFTLYLDDAEIGVRPFWNDAGEASLGWTWADGSRWSATIARRRDEYTIRRAQTLIARGGFALTLDPVRWQVDVLGTHRRLTQQYVHFRNPGNHTRVTWRDDDGGIALAAALQSCSYRTPVAIRPAGMTLAPALVGMLMITSYPHPDCGA